MSISIPKQTFSVQMVTEVTASAGVPIPAPLIEVGIDVEALPVELAGEVLVPLQSFALDALVHPCVAVSVVLPTSLIPQLSARIKPRARARGAHRQTFWMLGHADRAHRQHYRLGREAVTHADRWRIQSATRRQHLDAWEIGDWARRAHRVTSPLLVEARHAGYSRHVVAAGKTSCAYAWRIEAAHAAGHTLIADTRAALASGYAIRSAEVAAGHGFAWRAPIEARHEAKYAPCDLRYFGHATTIGDAAIARTGHMADAAYMPVARAGHALSIDEAPVVRAGHLLIDAAVSALAGGHAVYVGDAAIARAGHATTLYDAPVARASHATPYAQAGFAYAAHTALDTGIHAVASAHVVRNRIAGMAAGSASANYALSGDDAAVFGHQSRYALSHAAIWQADGRAALSLAGRATACISASVSADWGAGVWLASLEVDPASVIGVPLLESAVTLSIFGRQWSMIVTETALAERIEGVALSITASSPLARIASPPAATSTAWSTTPLSMSVWCARLAGQAVDWHLPDDPVTWPDARGEDAFEAVKKLAATPGGVLYADPDGDLAAWPWRGTGRGTAALAADEIIDMSVRRIRRTPVGSVTVSNAPADTIEYDAETRTARVIASRLRPLDLDHTAAGETTLVALGTENAAVSERVEIKAGRASVAHPIVSLGSVVWHGRPLAGSPVWRPGFADIAWDSDGYGIATINYTRREQKWRIDSKKPIVQLLVREEEIYERYHDNTGG